jgi:hypothetical protein
MDKKVPPEIIKQLHRWNFHSRVLRISHFVLVLIATICTVLVAAKLTVFQQALVQWLAALSAVSVSLISAFDLGSKANRMKWAWRKLNAAVILFQEDSDTTIKQLIKAYEKGEEIIGDVKEEP